MHLGPAATPITTGSLVAGRYRLVGSLGRGGSGTVYEAIDALTDRVRAIKVVDARVDEDTKQRFESEGMLTGRVESAHVVEVFDRGYDETLGLFYLVMERLRGEDLGALVAKKERLAIGEAQTLLGEIARGLEALHEEGVVHRDLKPENVFLAQEGKGARAVIVDLGLAKSFVTSVSVARTTRAIGTPVFMSPEQFRGDALVDARADIYAFGHVAYALLVGRPYFAPEDGRAANLYALLLQVAKGPPEPASVRARASDVELPARFDAWFAKAAHPEASERFDTAREAFAALTTALASADEPVVAQPRRSRRVRHAVAVAAGVVLLGTCLAAWRAPHVEARAIPAALAATTAGAVQAAPVVAAASLPSLPITAPPLASAASAATRAAPPSPSHSLSVRAPATRTTAENAPEAPRHDPLDSL